MGASTKLVSRRRALDIRFEQNTVGFLAIDIDQIFPSQEDQLQEITTDDLDHLCKNYQQDVLNDLHFPVGTQEGFKNGFKAGAH